MKVRDRERADRHRKLIAELKLSKGCVDCGYNKNAYALEFDHRENSGIPYTGRSKTVASMMYNSWQKILDEIAKCDVVCSNCHAIRTFTRRFASQ